MKNPTWNAPGAADATIQKSGSSTESRLLSLHPSQTTVLSLIFGYAAYYFCRQNFSAATLMMNRELGYSLEQLGMVGSLGTLTYAVGKVVTGSFSDRVQNGKIIFYIGLLGSVFFSGVLPAVNSIHWILMAWMMNRAFQSMGWGGVVDVVAQITSKKDRGVVMGWVSLSYQFGGILASLLVSYLVLQGVGWKGLFVYPALALFAVGALIFRFFQVPSRSTRLMSGVQLNSSTDAIEASEERPLKYRERYGVLLKQPLFIWMLGLSFSLTLLRECFHFWMPLYFSQLGMSDSSAVFKSTLFPLLGCGGTLFAGWFSDRHLHGKRIPILFGMLIGLVVSLFALSQLSGAMRLFGQGISPAAWASFWVGCTGFFLLGPYSLLGGVIALDFGGRSSSATAAGLLDGAGYLGASIAGFGIARLLRSLDWSSVYLVLTCIAVLTTLGAGVAWKKSKTRHL